MTQAEGNRGAVELDKYAPPQEALALVPRELAVRYKIFPVVMEQGRLKILYGDLFDRNWLNDFRFLTGKWVEFEKADPFLVLSLIDKYYSSFSSPRNQVSNNRSFTFKSYQKDSNLEVNQLKQEVEKAPIVKLVNSLITQAINIGASDLHLEPFDNEFKVRYRLDGMLQESEPIPQDQKAAVISRIKIMAELDIAERRRPQDGRIRVEGDNKVIDIRVSTLPTDFGEKVVLRILDKSQLKLELENLGFNERGLRIFEEKIRLPYGMILVTGPTGAGKTTTLYAALNRIKRPDINILTIEDPIEYNLEGINQSQVKPEIGFTFATALRHFLRQDPNVIMVGEIRDQETMEIAIRAALTGHLVLSTLHTNDAPSAITRLLDMGAEPFLVASSVTLVLAQRLVRSICEKCKTPTEIPTEVATKLGFDSNETTSSYKGIGCPACNFIGYKGRVAVFEEMPISAKLSDLISRKSIAIEIREQARQEGMSILRKSAIQKMVQGITTFEEVTRET